MEKPNRKVLAAILYADFLAFGERALHEVEPRNKLVLEDYILLTAQMLESVGNRKTRRLIINMPPRHLKSLLVSVFLPAWLLGREPHLKLIIVSHQTDLSQHFSRLIRQIISASWYREAFPGTQLSDNRNTVADFETTRGGGVRASSIKAGITGRGADIIIVDDPLDAKDAVSEVERSNVNEFFYTALNSRLDDPKTGVIIVVAQRLHENDLPGQLLKAGGWEHLCLPFIAPEDVDYHIGSRIWHRRKDDVLSPVRFGPDEIAACRREQRPHIFATQWQQNPTAAFGSLVEETDFPIYPERPRGYSRCIMSWDPALKATPQSSHSACVIVLEASERLFVVEVWRGQLDFVPLCSVAKHLIKTWGPTHILVEGTALGPALASELRRIGCNVIEVGHRGKSKVERLENNLDRLKARHVILCGGPWVPIFLDEMVRFPYGGDDQVDALTQLLTWVRENPAPTLKQLVTNPTRQFLTSGRNPQRDPGARRWR